MLKLHVVGNSAAGPCNGSACTGYVVSTRSSRFLVDCGPGVATAVGRTLDPIDLNAVIITHLHADHCYDLLPFAMSLRVRHGISSRQLFDSAGVDGPEMPRAIPVYLRSGGRALIEKLESHFPVSSPAPFDTITGGVLDFQERSGTKPIEVGDILVEPFAVQHSIPAEGLAISDGTTRLVFTGDTGLFDGLVSACAGADAILAEATLAEGINERRNHMSAADAGALARRSGVEVLILTHFLGAGEDTRSRAVEQARQEFSGNILIANTGQSIDL